jgi:hypothetical protein
LTRNYWKTWPSIDWLTVIPDQAFNDELTNFLPDKHGQALTDEREQALTDELEQALPDERGQASTEKACPCIGLCTRVKHWQMKIASIDEKSWPSIDRKVGQALTDDHAKHWLMKLGEADQTLTYEDGQALTDDQAMHWLMTRPSLDWCS